MHKSHRVALGIVSLLAWGLLLGVSIVANITFAKSFAHSEFEGHILSGGALASDMLKALAPIAFLWFVSQRRWWPAFSAFVIACVTVTFSTFAATGFVSGERLGFFDRVQREESKVETAKEEIDRLKEQRAFVPTHRPLVIVEAELSALKTERQWDWTEGCKIDSQKTAGARAFCDRFRKLIVEEAAARAAEAVGTKIAAERAQVLGAEYRGDYQAETIAKVTGMHQRTIVIMMVALTVLLIEIGASLGLTVALALLTDPTTPLGRALSVVAPERRMPEHLRPTPPFPVAGTAPAMQAAVANEDRLSETRAAPGGPPVAEPVARTKGLKPPKRAAPQMAVA